MKGKLRIEAEVVVGSFEHVVMKMLEHEFNKHDHSGDLLDRLEKRLNALQRLSGVTYAKLSDGRPVKILKALLPTKERGGFEQDWWEVRVVGGEEEILQVESHELTPLTPLEALAELACDD